MRIWLLKTEGRLVLVDRYPGLNRHLRRNNMWLRLNDMMYFVFPRADRYIFISAPPEMVFERKKELSVEEIMGTQENLRKRLDGLDFFEAQNIDLDSCLNNCMEYILLGRQD